LKLCKKQSIDLLNLKTYQKIVFICIKRKQKASAYLVKLSFFRKQGKTAVSLEKQGFFGNLDIIQKLKEEISIRFYEN